MAARRRRNGGCWVNHATVAPSPPAGLSRSDRNQPVLLLGSIAIGLAIGKLAPSVGAVLESRVAVGVFVLIYLVMLNVDLSGIARARRHRRFLGAAIALNFIVNPLLAWLLGAMFLTDQPELWAGLVLFLVTPCIGWYLVFTELAGGDAHLGVGLLGLNVVLQLLLLPVYLDLFLDTGATLDTAATIRSVALFLLAPACMAGATRRWWSMRGTGAAAEQERLRLPTLKIVALGVVIISMFASQAAAIFDQRSVLTRLLPPLLVFFGIAFLLAIVVARQLRLPYEQTALLVFTTTSRNSEASLAIAATAFTSPLVGLAVVLGPVVELPLLVAMVRILRRFRDAGVSRA